MKRIEVIDGCAKGLKIRENYWHQILRHLSSMSGEYVIIFDDNGEKVAEGKSKDPSFLEKIKKFMDEENKKYGWEYKVGE